MLLFQVNRQKALLFELLVFIYLFQALAGDVWFLFISDHLHNMCKNECRSIGPGKYQWK